MPPSDVVPDSPNEVCPLLNGMEAPTVNLHDASGNSVNLAAIFEVKPTVVVFYRGGW